MCRSRASLPLGVKQSRREILLNRCSLVRGPIVKPRSALRSGFPAEGQGWSLGRSPIAGGSLGGLEEAVQGSGVALGLLPRPGHLGRSLFAGVTRRFMTGKISDRPWAEGFAPGSTAASGIIHKWPASSAYGRSEISPPMNRRNPAPRRMARSCGSRCRTRGSDPPLNRLFSSP